MYFFFCQITNKKYELINLEIRNMYKFLIRYLSTILTTNIKVEIL